MPEMTITYRDADEADLPAIVALLADDVLGAAREDPSLPLNARYLDTFRAMQATPYQRLVVADEDGRIIGTMQLLVIPGLSAKGSWHGQIEAVRIASDLRGRGAGEAFVRWAVEQCRAAGCATVQLLSHRTRTAAHRFWERAGFEQSHLGFKMTL